ncbi:MAG: phosphatidate cytidylyltransferase [Caldimonas sp.]
MTSLRTLTTSQQVGLLFVTLFGVLLLATLVAFARSFREADDTQDALQERFARDLRAVWIGALLFWIAWAAGPFVSTLLFGFVSFFALREFVTLTHTRRADHRALLLAFFVVLPAQYVLVGLRLFNAFTVFIPVYVFFAIPVISALANDPQRFLERTAKIQWGIAVCVFGMSHAPALLLLDLPRWHERGAFLVFYLVVVVAVAQWAQELASRRLRRRPVARAISRSFSWRAWGAGAGAAAAVGTLLFWTTPFKPLEALVMGAIAGATGSLGEFVMKALKRDAGVRNWRGRTSVTGAVGLLDRVAPLCFAAPVFFHSVRWYYAI